ncbi:MAG: hypothetical protein GY757_07355, partial [bacterium]|nr:hypothetical protein [bacterium]
MIKQAVIGITGFILFFHLCLCPETPRGKVVGHVLGNDIVLLDPALNDLSGVHDYESRPVLYSKSGSELRRVILLRLVPYFKKEHKLFATQKDIRELFAYRYPREEEKRKQFLLEIETEAARLSQAGRKRSPFQCFREIKRLLKKISGYMEYQSSLFTPKEGRLLIKQIEFFKLNGGLYNRYGGKVAMTKVGQDPLDAWRAMAKDYQKKGIFKIYDKKLERAFWNTFRRTRRYMLAPGQIDFTPHWKRRR